VTTAVDTAGPRICRLRVEPELHAWLVTRANVAEVAEWAFAGHWPAESPDPCVWLRDERDAPVVPVRPGKYVVRGVTGHYFPCDPETFELLYELA
jgi:hypothetical protein